MADDLARALAFLTTDRWTPHFHDGGVRPTPSKTAVRPTQDCVVLLSGELDSLIGAIDLAARGVPPFAVSQIVRGDAEKQMDFATLIRGGLGHISAFSPCQKRRGVWLDALIAVMSGVRSGA